VLNVVSVALGIALEFRERQVIRIERKETKMFESSRKHLQQPFFIGFHFEALSNNVHVRGLSREIVQDCDHEPSETMQLHVSNKRHIYVRKER
jgi:hypothetical protein